MGKKIIFALMSLWMAVGYGQTLKVIRKIPHSGYSEGLDYHDGYLWHALPKQLVKIDPKTGSVLNRFTPATKYSESLVWRKGFLWNVSFHDNGLYRGTLKDDKIIFERKGSVPEKHAWGLTDDGKHLVVTGNFSKKLYFVNPDSGKVEREIETPIKDVEDLAWDGKGFWSSSFSDHKGSIFRIHPKTGKVSPIFQLPNPDECPVIDGIAFDGKNLYVTGKHCPSIFYIERPTERQITGNP